MREGTLPTPAQTVTSQPAAAPAFNRPTVCGSPALDPQPAAPAPASEARTQPPPETFFVKGVEKCASTLSRSVFHFWPFIRPDAGSGRFAFQHLLVSASVASLCDTFLAFLRTRVSVPSVVASLRALGVMLLRREEFNTGTPRKEGTEFTEKGSCKEHSAARDHRVCVGLQAPAS